ncbi:hypothetical protein Hanom_Chr10g00964951 [Helianthus anomalus]
MFDHETEKPQQGFPLCMAKVEKSNIVASERETPSNNLTSTKPCEAFNAEQRSNSSLFNVYFFPVFP